MKLDRKGPPQPGEASRPPGTKPPRKAQRLTEPPSSSEVAPIPTAQHRQDVVKLDASSGTPAQSKKRSRQQGSGDEGIHGREESKVAREEKMDAQAMLAALDTTQLTSILGGLEAGVSLADLIAEARRRLAAGGEAVEPAAAKEKKSKKKKKEKKEKKEKKSQ